MCAEISNKENEILFAEISSISYNENVTSKMPGVCTLCLINFRKQIFTKKNNSRNSTKARPKYGAILVTSTDQN